MQEKETTIFNYLNGHLGEEECRALEQWIAQTDDHQDYFDQIEKIHQLTGYSPHELQPNVAQAWSRVQGAMVRKRKANTWAYKIAAILTLAVGLAGLAYYYQSAPEWIVVQTHANELKHIELADGSEVWLNENTVLKYPESINIGSRREVALDGQAFFEVKQDPKRPFTVLGESANVRVLGTVFDLVSRANYANVNVKSGVVSVALTHDDNRQLVVKKGKQATYVHHTLTLNAHYNENASSWMTQDFVFQSTPLLDVAQALSKHFKVKIVVRKSMQNCLITSRFKDKSLQEILEVLEAIARVKSKKQGDIIHITGEGC